MDNELLYEVDEHDQVIGPRTRGELHRLGLRHRAVHVLVFNSRNEVFLQKRSAAKDTNPGLWDTSAAGHVDFGESYEQCALRELKEELGITEPERFQLLFKLPASEHTGWEFIQIYRTVHDGDLRLNEDEIAEGQWITVEALENWIQRGGQGLTASFLAIWREISSVSGRDPRYTHLFSAS